MSLAGRGPVDYSDPGVRSTQVATDREVIVLRHFEELTNDKVATVLGLTKAAASKRYVRAMLRLRDIIGNSPGLADGSRTGGNG